MQRWLPEPFVFAVLLTFVAALLAMPLCHQTPIEVIEHWGGGVWGLLAFAMQMSLVLVCGAALASAFRQMSEVALENISDKINKESYYIRVAAGTEFYLYIEQVTNIEKAAIADTALNNLAQLKQAQRNNRDNEVDKRTPFQHAGHEASPSRPLLRMALRHTF